VLQIERAKRTGQPRMLPDGGCLYLQDGASWLFRYGAGGKRYMGLGSLTLVDLRTARQLAQAARKLLHDGIDPITHRNSERVQAALAAARTMTFAECADVYIAAHREKWRHPTHERQWRSTLAIASKIIGRLPVRDIDLPEVLKVLEPIWTTTPDRAKRLQGRIAAVLGWATVRGYRSGENPARWKDHLSHALPSPGELHKVDHFPALSLIELPAFMAELLQHTDVAAQALQLLVLTAVRSGDIIGGGNRGSKTPAMCWSHVDLDRQLWTIPKTKTGKEHVVPLSGPAIAILQRMQSLRAGDDGVVFPGRRPGRSLGESTMLGVLQRLGRRGLSVHGFRATFKTWAGERTEFPREVIEACLSHTIGSKVEAAYRRGTFLDKRARLMADWADYVTGGAPAGVNVVA
jgi:integrase